MSKLSDRLKQLEKERFNKQSALSGAAIVFNGMLARGEITEEEFLGKKKERG